MKKIIENIAKKYDLNNITSQNRYGNGHINKTYLVETLEGKYIFQNVNTSIFTRPVELMENINKVTSFLKERIKKDNGDIQRETMNILKTADNSLYYIDDIENTGFWRVYYFVKNTIYFDVAKKREHIYHTGMAFGKFIKQLDEFDASQLDETIENFHNTSDRLLKFQESLRLDKHNRAKNIQNEIDFILERKDTIPKIVDALKNNEIPSRVTHNDTKLNNILFDNKTEKPICIIDLDTVMPGSFLYDYGDSIRSTTANAAEDETDLEKVSMNTDLFKAITEGYLHELYNVLNKEEIELMPIAAVILTLECGIRFLTDYLDGDVYFNISKENHNLHRAKNQFAMVKSIEDNLDFMEKYISEIICSKQK